MREFSTGELELALHSTEGDMEKIAATNSTQKRLGKVNQSYLDTNVGKM